jgi:hypothetical protein
MKVSRSMAVCTSDYQHAPVAAGAVFEWPGTRHVPAFRCLVGQKGSVDNVHTYHLGLPRSAAGLPRILHVSAASQCSQGLESRSSPTSGTAYPLVRGGFCFNVCTFCLVRSL